MSDPSPDEREIRYKMISEMAHELRTPLGGIIGLNELMLTTALDPEQKEFSQTVHASAKSMLSVLTDIVELSRLENEKVTLASTSLSIPNVVEECVFAVRKNLKAHKIDLELSVDTSIPDLVRGDAVKLRQLLICIINGVTKYVEEGAITLAVAHKQNHARTETVRFTVGLPPNVASRDNEPLFKLMAAPLDARATRYDGTWLRLRIARIILEMMEAKVEVSNDKLSFTICFPIDGSERSAEVEKEQSV